MRSLASRLYALTLLAFPAHHRAQYRHEMVDAFTAGLADRRRRNGALTFMHSARVELTIGSTLAGAVGVIALTLAALGVFGVIGFMVATRTREIGSGLHWVPRAHAFWGRCWVTR